MGDDRLWGDDGNGAMVDIDDGARIDCGLSDDCG